MTNYLIPQYALDMPVPNLCESCGCNEFPIVQPVNTGGKPTRVTAGAGISVANLSDASEYHFQVSRVEIIALNVSLSLIAKEAGVVKTSPILKGTVIDAVELDWTYNKVIATQTLTNNNSLTPPTLSLFDIDFDYDAQSIISNTTFTITGNDGLGVAGSIDTATASISFGNLMWLGYGASKFNSSSSTLEAFIESLQINIIKTSRTATYYATGVSNQKHFVAYPAAYGLAIFTKGIFSGGYVRLKKVGLTIKSDLDVSDIESDIIFTNSKGYAQTYYVYESLFDNQADAVTPFIIS